MLSSFAIERIELVDARLRGLLTGAKTKLRIAMRLRDKTLDYTFEIDLLGAWKLAFDKLPEKIVDVFK